MVFKFIRNLCAAGTLLASAWGAQAALNLADPLPIGPQVMVGQLPNGLTYYIQKNKRPENRLELRLAVKAGSILEDELQRDGLHPAHSHRESRQHQKRFFGAAGLGPGRQL